MIKFRPENILLQLVANAQEQSYNCKEEYEKVYLFMYEED